MTHKNPSKKAHSVGSMLVIVALLVSIISFGFFTENNGFDLIDNGNNEVTGAVIGMESVTGYTTNAPAAPAAPQSPSAPAASEKIYESPDKIPIGGSKGHPVTENGQKVYYYKACTTCALQKYQGSSWVTVEFNFRISGTDSQGNKIAPLTYIATTQQEALKKAQIDLPGTSLTATRADTPSIERKGSFQVKIIENKNFAVNTETRTTIRIPDDTDANIFVKELNYRTKIQQEYDNWLRSQGYQDTRENREFFKAHPPRDVDSNLIDSVLELTSPKGTEAKKDTAPVERTTPDDKKYWEFEGIRYFNQDEANAAASFKKDRPTAKKTDYVTSAGKPIFTEKNKYILQTGQKFEGEAVKTEKIGGIDYPVTYSFASKTPKPTKIQINSDAFNLNSNVLSQLRSKVGEDDNLVVRNGNLIHTKTSEKTEGKEEEISYKKTTSTTIEEYSNNGLLSSTIEEQTVDEDNNIIAKKEVKRTFQYDSKSNKDIPNEVIETTYEKGTDGFIDSSKTRVLTTNALTGEPISLEYSNKHPRFGKEKEDLELLKTQFASRKFFAQLESTLTDFSGLGYYATLFFDDEDLDAWRETVDETFATLYLGTEYWTSAVCSTHVDRDQEGVAYVDTALGLAGVAAHIEATRSQQIDLPEGVESSDATSGLVNATETEEDIENRKRGIVTKPPREFLYKITFNVKNGDWDHDPRALEKLEFNIFLKGERTAKLFGSNIKLDKGDEFGHIGDNAIVQFSSFLYNQICIKFDDVPVFWTLDDDELCNKIIGAPSQPLPIEEERQITSRQETGVGNILDI